VVCWGSWGSGTSTAAISGLSNVDNVSIGDDHGCSLINGGSIKCWGNNYYGQLGNGSTTSSTSAVSVSGISNATQVSSGSNYSCAVLDDNTIKCWGQRTSGKLGNGSTGGTGSNDKSTSPVAVTGISDAVQVSAGKNHTCALLTNGGIKCWGDGSYSKLGDGDNNDRNTPVTTGNSSTWPMDYQAPVLGWSSVDAGGDYHTCGILDNKVYCWGDGTGGRTGSDYNCPSYCGDHRFPYGIKTTNNSEYSKIAVGESHSCGISGQTGIGKLFCWGMNSSGQLGHPKLTNSTNSYYDFTYTPLEVSIYDSNSTKVNVRDISVSYNHSCAITEDYQTFCWGKAEGYILGDGVNSSSADYYRRTPYQICDQ